MQPQLNNTPLRTFFLFINPGSGGNLGKQMLENQVQKYQFNMGLKGQQDIRRIDAYIFDLKKDSQLGFTLLKQMNSRKEDTVAVVCGGDGTIMWVLSYLEKYKIDPMYTPIAIIPLGTGNDFSRNLGWGGNPFFKWSTSQLRQFIRNWMEADIEQFDIWDSISAVFENGSFEKVSKQKDTLIPQKIVRKTFCNYFSFGIDGQIGYNFDKFRTPSKFANFAVYGAIGALNDLKNPITVNQILQSIYETPIPQDQQNYKDKGRLALHTQHKKLILHCRQDSSQVAISEGQRNILALNIDSYTGGTTEIWKRAKVSLKNEYTAPAKHSDGLIEIVSFDSSLGIAMQKSVGGFAKRIIQSDGPLRFNFRREETKSQHCTYLQIDGQFLRMRHPRYIIIRKSEMLGGKIRVLKRNEQKKIFNPFKDLQDLFK